jgi:hypothetical protein
MYGSRAKLSPEQTAHNAKVKSDRALAAMTCQCCSGRILANTGVIAHHGYQRPSEGWQTASCFGARALPFEVDRSRLGELIVAIDQRLRMQRAGRADVIAEKYAIERGFADYSAAKIWNGRRHVTPDIKIKFTRNTFDAQRTTHAELLRRNSFYPLTFDELKKNELATRDYQIKQTSDDLRRCKKKYDGWMVTHEWVPGPAGVKLMPKLAVSKDSLGGWNKLPEGLMRLSAVNGSKP